MTKREVAELMTVLQANYPDSFRGQSDLVVSGRVTLWYDFFKDYPKDVVYAAAKAFMATDTKGFMPNVGQIAEQIRNLTASREMTEQEAWSLVSNALRNSSYGSVEEFAKLPPLIQKVVGSPEQLKMWAMMEADVVQSVVSSNFQRSFRTGQNRDRDLQKLPGDVKAFISQIAGTAIGRLEDGHDEVS